MCTWQPRGVTAPCRPAETGGGGGGGPGDRDSAGGEGDVQGIQWDERLPLRFRPGVVTFSAGKCCVISIFIVRFVTGV